MAESVKRTPDTSILFKACCIVFAISLILTIPANSGGPDAGIFWGYLNFLLLIFISLPLHVLSLFLIIYFSKKYSAWSQYYWFYVYIIVYFAVHLVVLGPALYQPTKEILGELTYNITHKKDVALFNELRSNPDTEQVRSLIEKGADVNTPDRTIGFTPLMWAAREGNMEIINMLLEAGADPFFINKDIKGSLGFHNTATVSGMGALAMAAWVRKDEDRHNSVMLLLKQGVKPDTGSVLGACFHGDVDLLNAQLERGADLDVKDDNNSTCLHQAALGDKPGMITYLLEQGVDATLRTIYGQTPLDSAINQHREKAMLTLMQAGLRTESPDSLKRYLYQAPDTPEKAEIKQLLEGDE